MIDHEATAGMASIASPITTPAASPATAAHANPTTSASAPRNKVLMGVEHT